MYNGKMVLKSNNEKTQAIFNKVLSVFDKNKNGSVNVNDIKSLIIKSGINKEGQQIFDEFMNLLKQ